MARSPSLTRRVTVALIAVQFVAFIAALFLLVFIQEGKNFLANIGSYRANILVGEEIVKGADGKLSIANSERMAEFAKRNPEFWYIVTDGTEKVIGTSEAAEKVLDIRGLAEAVQTTFVMTKMRAAVEFRTTPVGETLIVAGGVSANGFDILALIYYVFVKQALLLVLPISVGSLLVIGLIARRALKSLRSAADAAEKINPDNHGERLPVDGTPRELLPLVKAVNSALERLDEGYEQQRRFIADAAHELRTPVAVLRTRLDALPDGMLKDELLNDARRVSDLATGLLELERLRRTALEEEPVDLVALARTVVAELGPLALDRGYDIAVEADAPAVVVVGDEAALHRVLCNLVGNAISHGGGRGLINVHVFRTGTIAVSDQGPGVPPDAAELIFEPFHRVASAGSGAGLGLALARDTMVVHGGRLRLMPHAGSGAVFRMEFPPERLCRQAA